MFKISLLKIFATSLWIMCFLVTSVPCDETDDESGRISVPTTARTQQGIVEGRIVTFRGIPVREFLGVPFAKPPLGELRFKKPVPMDSWSGTRKAVNQPPACTQITDNPFPWYDFEPGKSEDCLYLNIWTPAGSFVRNKAVMYWMFGGGYFIGSIRKPIYDGRAIAARGDIIVVTVSYRLGSFGFLTSGTDDAPGNIGIWDSLAGLKWVKDNIRGFGGDPNKITLAGESAGAVTAGLLSVSPLARGLYIGQIMESASPAWLLTENKTMNLGRSQRVAELVGCANQSYTISDHPQQVVACLRNVDALELSKAETSLIPHSSRSYLPTYGDEIIPQNARLAVAQGNFQKNPVLIGNNKDEGAFQISTSNPDLYGFFGDKNPNISRSQARTMLQNIFTTFNFSNPDAAVNFYLPDSIGEDEYDLSRRQLYTGSGDFTLLCPTVYFAESYASRGADVYFYFFTKRPSTTPWAPWLGVTHYEEVQFVFGSPLKNPQNYEAGETTLSAEIIQNWSRFVKNGRPSRTWPKYSKENPTLRILDVGVGNRTGYGPHRSACDFFRPYFGF